MPRFYFDQAIDSEAFRHGTTSLDGFARAGFGPTGFG
jgi:hypothetical protein